MDTYLIVGLGNPGERYAHTRHNAGFDVIAILAERLGIRVSRRKSHALVGEGVCQGRRIILAKPQTYMNLSGGSVAALTQWYKVPPGRLLLLYDDADLPPGTVRVRSSGSPGTHNGMRSVIELLGREDFPRIRVGIGSAPPGWDMADWVTSHYESAEARQIAFDSYLRAAEAALTYITEGADACMRRYNRRPSCETSSLPR